VMLALNRTLFDLGRDVFRRQQDAAIAAALRSLGAPAAPDRRPAEAGFADILKPARVHLDGGRPRVSDRRVLAAIFFVLRTARAASRQRWTRADLGRAR
jgi:hypothetical protein